MKHIATLLLLPICAIPLGMGARANAGEAPTGSIASSGVDPSGTAPHRALDLSAPELRYLTFSGPGLDTTTTLLSVEEPESVAVTASAEWNEAGIDVHPSVLGLGSVYWAVHHPIDAWRVLLPTWPGAEPDVSADLAAEYLIRTKGQTGAPSP